RVDFETDEQPASPDFADQRTLHRFQLREKIFPQLRGTFDQVFVVEHGERLQRDRGGKRIATERAAMIAGTAHLHHFVLRNKSRHRQHSAAERLAENNAVWKDTLMLAGE